MKRINSKKLHLMLLLFWVFLPAFFFANVEIQIEGAHGWAASLPTWRIEKHQLLDIFWGGRPMTGYHASIFSFMFLVFHLPQVLLNSFSLRVEARCLGCLMLFWITEDFLWFVMNPAFGIARFSPAFVPWHKQWLLGMPTDYLVFTFVGGALLAWSFGE